MVESTGPGPVEQATAAELAGVGRLDTVAGQCAVVLARRLDEHGRDTGGGVASVAKEFRNVMDAALANVEKAADPLDELRARRDRKRAAGGRRSS